MEFAYNDNEKRSKGFEILIFFEKDYLTNIIKYGHIFPEKLKHLNYLKRF